MKRLIALIALLTASAYGAGTMQVKDATGTTITVNKPAAQGTAGAPSPDVLTVQGATGMTPIKTDSSATTQPVSGTVAVSNFPAFPTTQPVSGSVSVSNFPATQPVSIATAVPVTGTFYQTTQPISISATVTTQDIHTTAAVPLAIRLSDGTSFYNASGGGGGGTSSNFAASFPTAGTAIGVKDSAGTNLTFLKANASNALVVDGSAVTQPISGTITANAGTGTMAVSLATFPALATGSNTIGALTANQSVNQTQVNGVAVATGNGIVGTGVQRVAIASDNSAVPVSGTFYQATQPVSAAALPLPSGASTETTLAALNTKIPASPATEGGNLATLVARTPVAGQAVMASSSPVVIASNQSAVPVSGTFWQTTQPVSLASAPTTPVTGTFWQATQPISGTVSANATQTGTWTVQPGNTANTTAWKVDASSTTVPVSIAGTVNTTDTHTTAAAPISVRLTDGSAFYTSSSSSGGGLTDAQLRATPVPVASSSSAPSMYGAAADYSPGYGPAPAGTLPLSVDPSGNLNVRGTVLTDEGGYRANFSNSSLAVTIGTCTFTNGSAIVSGTALSTYDVHMGDYVYLTADGITAQRQIEYITETEIGLTSVYAGTGGTGAASRQALKSIAGTGTSVAVASGQVTLTAGTTATSIVETNRLVDYLPLTKNGRFSISQRIANQDIYYGFYDEGLKWWYWFQFTGTTNTTVNCVCAWNPTTTPTGNEIVTTAVTLPNGATTATTQDYRIDVLKDRIVFSIAGIPVYTETRVVPHPHDPQTSTLRIVNGTTPATSTTVVADYDGVSNFNVLAVENPNRATDFIATQPALDSFTYNVGGVITINTDLLSIDCSRYRAIEFQCTSMGTTGVVTIQAADEPSFAAPITVTTFGIDGSAVATTFNAAVKRFFNTQSRYIRFRLTTATTAGTTTIYAHGSQVPFQTWLATQPVSLSSTTVTSVSAGTNNIGLVTPAPVAAATSAMSVGNAASLTVLNTKASAGSVYGVTVVNKVASVIYLQFYNTAGTPTLGTSVISWIPVAASSTLVIPPGSFALANYATGIGIGASTTPTSTGTPGTAPDVTIWYK